MTDEENHQGLEGHEDDRHDRFPWVLFVVLFVCVSSAFDPWLKTAPFVPARLLILKLDMRLIIDIGGEGRHAGAVNVNTRCCKTLGPDKGEPIPRLLCARADALPLASQSATEIIVERTPLSPAALAEIARVIAPGGTVVLRHVPLPQGDRHARAKEHLGGHAVTGTLRLAGQWVQETRILVA